MVDNPLNSPTSSRIVLSLTVLCAILVGGLLLPSAQTLAAGLPEEPITGECRPLVQKAGRGFTLCGTLNPHSSAKVGAYFAFNQGGTCADPAESEVAAEAEKEEGQDIEAYGELEGGLKPGTEYTYCLVATNSFGESFGQGVSFTTTADPKIEAATAVTATSATLEGTLEPSGTKLEYEFWYSKGASCEGGVPASRAQGENKVSAKVEGLRPNTEYTFCLIAKGREEGLVFQGETDAGTAIGQPEHFTTPESQAEKEVKEKLEQEAKAKAEAEVKARAEAKAKAEAEAAVATAKKKQEEVAAKQQEEAAAAAAQKKKESESASRSVSLTIVKVRVTASSVTITLGASQEGAVTISGFGLKTTTKGVAAGSNQIRVAFTKVGKSCHKHHRKVKIAVQLKALGRAVSGSRMVKL